MRRMSRILPTVFTSILAAGIASGALAQELRRLHPEDPVYRQHQALLEDYHAARARNMKLPPLSILYYAPREEDTLFSIAARLTIPYDTIATLNRLSRPKIPEGPLMIPTQPGLFLYDDPETDLERKIAGRLQAESTFRQLHIPADDQTARSQESVRFYPGTAFSSAERTRFLRVVFMDPLPGGMVSSRYGYRRHPMWGTSVFHRGIDISAPFGTPVLSAAPGVVTEIRRDPQLGLSVHMDHREEYSTVYAHLQEAMVSVGDRVEAGQQIGAVGSTGFSTGPHLHFEILRDGKNRDPEPYIR